MGQRKTVFGPQKTILKKYFLEVVFC